jgi:hypothetical protein
MNAKKLRKRMAHAEMVWEREQLKAAMIAEQLNKAIAAVEQYKNELTDEQITAVHEQVNIRRKELEEYVTAAKAKYLTKLDELVIKTGLEKTEPTPTDSLKEL